MQDAAEKQLTEDFRSLSREDQEAFLAFVKNLRAGMSLVEAARQTGNLRLLFEAERYVEGNLN